MEGAIVVCYPYVKSEQQKIAETRLAQIAKRCLNPDPIDSPIVAVRDIELPHIRIINDNERIVRY